MSTTSGSDAANKQANEVEKAESLRGWAGIGLSTALVCSTAMLFTAGHSYRLGYFYELGFDLAQLPASFHETLYWGFAGGVPLAVTWLIATMIVLLGVSLLYAITGPLLERISNRFPRVSPPASYKRRRKMPASIKYLLAALLLVPLIYGIGLAYLAGAEFQKAGSKKARQLTQAFRTDPVAASTKHGTQKIELWFNSPSETVVRGYRLLCTERACSIYDPDSKVRTIRLVSLDNLREIRIVR